MRSLAAMLAAAFVIGACAGSSPTSQVTPTPAETPTPSAPLPTTTPSLPLATPTGPSADNSSFKFTTVATGLNSPVYVTDAGDGSGRLFIVEQQGRILILQNGVILPTPFLDIRSLVASGGERGLLSVAFHPQYKTNGIFVVNYTRDSSNPADMGDTVIARYTASPPTTDRANPESRTVLLTIDQPQPNHNGGLVKFGPDGFLYIGMGDGAAAGTSAPATRPKATGRA